VADRTSLAGDLFFGKWFSHKVGARLYVDGGSIHSFYTNRKVMIDQEYLSGRLDLMLNLTNLLRSYSPDRFYNMIPYAGAGALHAFNGKEVQMQKITRLGGKSIAETCLIFGGGLLNTFRLSNKVSLFLDLSAHALNIDTKIDVNGENGPGGLEGLVAGSVGLVFNFGKSAKKEVVPPPVVQETRPAPPPQPQPQPQPQPEPPKPFVYDYVFFRLDKWEIDANQQNGLRNTADYLKANPNISVNVVGYADVETGNPRYNLQLSEKRARNVARELVERYGISSTRLRLSWKGDTVQHFTENDKNRVVIFTE
jgi:outer membrane protein OmpA-like peptidoglycan-associated protein